MKSAGFKNLVNFVLFWGRGIERTGVGIRPQNFERACRRSQNGSSDALPATILGASVEMLLYQCLHMPNLMLLPDSVEGHGRMLLCPVQKRTFASN
jgi:hypothetical protein